MPGTVGGTVPATLSLTLGTPATFGAFTPGVAKDYTASTTANVISTAGDAALSVAPVPAYLTNGTFSLPQPLQVSFSKSTWTAPVSNEPVTITFKQPITATDALRTGAYSQDAHVHVEHDDAVVRWVRSAVLHGGRPAHRFA